MSGPAQGGRPTVGRPPRRGDRLELEVGPLLYGGEGLARVDGYVVLVSGAVEGDRVVAQVYKRRSDYAQARTVELLSPSPLRVPPKADHPGVPWQVLPYNRQLEIKLRQVEEALRRLGNFTGYRLEGIVPAKERWRYRNKVELSFGFDGQGKPVLGFHAPARWNQVVAVEDCLLTREPVNRALAATREWLSACPYQPWERGSGAKGQRAGADSAGRARLRNLVVREGRRSEEVQVRVVVTPGEFQPDGLLGRLQAALGDHLAGFFLTTLDALSETTYGGQTVLLYGRPTVREEVCGLTVEIPPTAFFQTNTEMAEVLYLRAKEYAALAEDDLLLDLYCGLGTIGLVVGRGAAAIEGVELAAEAVQAARATAARAGITAARFHQGEVHKVLPAVSKAFKGPPVVVVDPPRAGLGRRAAEAVLAAAPKRIVYVSCNPTTLAGDGVRLAQAGYRLKRMVVVDLFPQTPHIECVALFDAGR